MTRTAGEIIDQYITDLKTKAQMCHDRIVCGITCDKIRARLLKESELMLQTALNLCRANEATSSQFIYLFIYLLMLYSTSAEGL